MRGALARAHSCRDRARLECQLREASVKVDRLVAAIADGAGEFAEVKAALQKALAERDGAREQFGKVDAMPVVALHPTVATDYRRQIESLNQALANPEERDKAVPALRNLIGRIVIRPIMSRARGVEIDVEGRLAAILALAGGKPPSEERMFVMERVKGIEPSS